jgi:hypothetical protein
MTANSRRSLANVTKFQDYARFQSIKAEGFGIEGLRKTEGTKPKATNV